MYHCEKPQNKCLCVWVCVWICVCKLFFCSGWAENWLWKPAWGSREMVWVDLKKPSVVLWGLCPRWNFYWQSSKQKLLSSSKSEGAASTNPDGSRKSGHSKDNLAHANISICDPRPHFFLNRVYLTWEASWGYAFSLLCHSATMFIVIFAPNC